MADLPDGWLNGADQRELQVLAFDKTVLELGAWKGRSTVVLAGVASYVISVDRHEGIPTPPCQECGESSLPAYLDAVRELPNVAIVVAHFEAFVPMLAARRFDLVFIDGDHDYASVQRHTTLALMLDPPVIAYHDWDFAEVREGATVILGEPDGVGGSVAHFKRRA